MARARGEVLDVGFGIGCNLNRDTERAILDAGFRLEEIERFQASVAGCPEVMSHMIRGVATA